MQLIRQKYLINNTIIDGDFMNTTLNLKSTNMVVEKDSIKNPRLLLINYVYKKLNRC